MTFSYTESEIKLFADGILAFVITKASFIDI